MKFEVFPSSPKSSTEPEWYWRVKGDNYEVWCVSEGFTRKDDAIRSILDFRLAVLISRPKIQVIDLTGAETEVTIQDVPSPE